MKTTELDKSYIAGTYNRWNLEALCGKGELIRGEDGKSYIDLGSGIAVNSFGICDDSWIAAVTEQMKSLSHVSNLYYSQPQAKLAQMLCERTGMKKVFFGNSGAEANECAIKCARKYSLDKYGSGRHRIITLQNSFHGRTLATLAATGQDSLHQHFFPFPEGFDHVPANDFDALSDLCNETVCAVMLELVQGEGGVIPLDPEYVSHVARLCDERDILLIIDEVQTGNGRTGSLYAFMQYGINPDIVTTAKGLAGGLPMGVCMMGEKTENTLSPGTHGSTFGGNPICASGAISVLSRIDEQFLGEIQAKSRFIFDKLQGAPGVLSVTGLGLMIGISTEKPAKDVVTKCLEEGVIALTAHEKIRLLPPLNISWEKLKEAIYILKGVIG